MIMSSTTACIALGTGILAGVYICVGYKSNKFMKKQDGGLTTARLLLSMANDNATRLQVVEDKVGLLMKDMSKICTRLKKIELGLATAMVNPKKSMGSQKETVGDDFCGYKNTYLTVKQIGSDLREIADELCTGSTTTIQPY